MLLCGKLGHEVVGRHGMNFLETSVVTVSGKSSNEALNEENQSL